MRQIWQKKLFKDTSLPLSCEIVILLTVNTNHLEYVSLITVLANSNNKFFIAHTHEKNIEKSYCLF